MQKEAFYAIFLYSEIFILITDQEAHALTPGWFQYNPHVNVRYPDPLQVLEKHKELVRT